MLSRKQTVPKTGSRVDRIYEQLRQMAMNYKFRPGEPLNEVELAASFGVSRTPLRDVLNRLVAEGLLDFVPRHCLVAERLHNLADFTSPPPAAYRGMQQLACRLTLACDM